MLTFIAITTVINLALGYGLAIYLMRAPQGQSGIGMPVKSPVGNAEQPSPTPPVTTVVTGVLPSASPASSPQPEMPTPELSELVSPLQSTQSQSTQPQPKNPVSSVPNPAIPGQDSDTLEDSDSDTQPPSEEDLLAGIAAFRAQLSAENPTAESDGGNEVETNTTPTSVPGNSGPD